MRALSSSSAILGLLLAVGVVTGCGDDSGGATDADTGTTSADGESGTSTGDGDGDGDDSGGATDADTGTTSADGESGTSTGGESGTSTGDGDGDGDGECGVEGVPPVVHYRFDDCSATSPEAMGSGLDATLTAANCDSADSLSDSLTGEWASGTALNCSASVADCASVASDPLLKPAHFTISAWVYSADWASCGNDGSPGEETCTIVSNGNLDNPNGYRFHVRNDAGSPVLGLALEPDYGLQGGTPTNATWHLITGTFDGETAAIYIDGVSVGSEPGTFAYTDDDLQIGWMLNRGYSHNGLIDELKLWDFAKTDAQVTALYSSYLDCE